MEKSIDRLQHEMASLRTGRATAGMLDHIKADVYGESLSLKSLGLTVVRDPQMLVFTAFDSGVRAIALFCPTITRRMGIMLALGRQHALLLLSPAIVPPCH